MLLVVDVLKKTEAFFRQKGIPSPRWEAEILMAHVMGLSRVQLYMQHEQPLTEKDLVPIRDVVRRRSLREPLAWILGRWDFFEHEFLVHPGVLCPRSDTETLVRAALPFLSETAEQVLVDVGSGTGCVGLSLALKRPMLRVFSVDLSDDALRCTAANVAVHALTERAAVLKGDLLSPVPASAAVDVVVGNPPYIDSGDIDGLEPEVSAHEPRLALDGGPDGLAVYRRLIPAAAARARVAVLVEVGAGQAPAVAALFTAAGLHDVRTHKDLGGHERVVEGRCSASA